MAVRHFDGVDDIITVSPPSPNWSGGGSLAVVWRADTPRNNGLLCFDAAGFDRWSLITAAAGSVNEVYVTHAGPFLQFPNTVADEWYLTVFTRPSGTDQTVRSHTMPFSTGVWAHEDEGTLSDSPVSQTGMQFGHQIANDFYLLGDLAAVGMWRGTVLSDGECETLDTGLAAWVALTPDGLWAFDQADVGDPVLDLTGNGADQTAITGTAVLVGDDPPGFSFSLDEPPAEAQADYPVDVTFAVTTARDSEVETGHAVDVTLAVETARPSQAAADYPVDVTLATTTRRTSRIEAGYPVEVTLAVELQDPTAPPVNAPPLVAAGAHDRGLAAVGAHDRTLVATGSHPT